MHKTAYSTAVSSRVFRLTQETLLGDSFHPWLQTFPLRVSIKYGKMIGKTTRGSICNGLGTTLHSIHVSVPHLPAKVDDTLKPSGNNDGKVSVELPAPHMSLSIIRHTMRDRQTCPKYCCRRRNPRLVGTKPNTLSTGVHHNTMHCNNPLLSPAPMHTLRSSPTHTLPVYTHAAVVSCVDGRHGVAHHFGSHTPQRATGVQAPRQRRPGERRRRRSQRSATAGGRLPPGGRTAAAVAAMGATRGGGGAFVGCASCVGDPDGTRLEARPMAKGVLCVFKFVLFSLLNKTNIYVSYVCVFFYSLFFGFLDDKYNGLYLFLGVLTLTAVVNTDALFEDPTLFCRQVG